MEAIILAAGYATRLYPLTENIPKPLLTVAGKPMVEHIIKKIEDAGDISRICIVTNNKFENHFKRWLEGFDAKTPIEIVNDGSKSNEDRLGALGDVNYVISAKSIGEDFLVIAGDNLFELSLKDALNFSGKSQAL